MSYLVHHGILGQKWGKRNGPPYPLDLEDHSAAEKKANPELAERPTPNEQKHQSKIVASYKNKYERMGLSSDEAQTAAERKAKILKRIAIGAGVVVGAAVVYGVYRQVGVNYMDDLIKSGATIQTVSMDPDRMRNGESFFTAFTQTDKDVYLANFGRQLNAAGLSTGDNKEVITAMVRENIRIAGRGTAEKIYRRLLKDNPDFATAIDKKYGRKFALQRLQNANSGKFFSSDYELFNQLCLLEDSDGKIQSTFYDALRAAGYGAVSDINDRKFSGFNTRAAIVFDRSGITDYAHHKLTSSEINDAKPRAFAQQIFNANFKPITMSIGSIFVGSRILKGADSKIIKEIKEKQVQNDNGDKQ